MALKFQFLNESLGPLTIVNDPIGINDISQKIKRSSELEGIVYEVILNIDFIKEGRRYLIAAFDTFGPDTVVKVNLYSYDPNLRAWQIYYTGTVNFGATFNVSETTFKITLDQTGIQRTVANLMDFEVDLEATSSYNGTALPAQSVIDLPYHSKKIIKNTTALPVNELLYDQPNGVGVISVGDGASLDQKEIIAYGQFDFTQLKPNDLDQFFSLPFGWVSMDALMGFGDALPGEYESLLAANKNPRFPVYTAKENGACDISISLNLRHGINAASYENVIFATPEATEINAWFEWRDAVGNIKQLTNIGEFTMANFVGEHDDAIVTRYGDYELKTLELSGLDIEIGDSIYIYETIRIFGIYSALGGSDIFYGANIQAGPGTSLSIETNTVDEVLNRKTILIHEATERCVQFYSNEIDSFESTLLGRTDLGYEDDGELSLIGFTNGKNLRDIDAKIINSLEKILEFINAITPIGIGFVEIDGRIKMVVEKISYFYDKDNSVVSLGEVYEPEKVSIPKKFYNSVKFGYSSKMNIKQTNGIDEINTSRKFLIPVVNTKNVLTIQTSMRASGYEIEFQKRLSSKTEDSQLDDENFAVCVIRDGEGFKTQSNEGYDAFENILNPETGYNYNISPARCLRNWGQVIASGLIRSSSKTLKFMTGDKNYKAGTKKISEPSIIYEDGDVDLSGYVPIWDNFLYKIKEVKLTRSQVKLFKSSPYTYIEFKDRFGVKMEGFISNDQGVDDESNKGQGTFELLKVYRP